MPPISSTTTSMSSPATTASASAVNSAGRQRGVAGLGRIQHGDPGQLDALAGKRLQPIGAVVQRAGEGGADIAAAQHADPNMLIHYSRLFARALIAVRSAPRFAAMLTRAVRLFARALIAVRSAPRFAAMLTRAVRLFARALIAVRSAPRFAAMLTHPIGLSLRGVRLELVLAAATAARGGAATARRLTPARGRTPAITRRRNRGLLPYFAGRNFPPWAIPAQRSYLPQMSMNVPSRGLPSGWPVLLNPLVCRAGSGEFALMVMLCRPSAMAAFASVTASALPRAARRPPRPDSPVGSATSAGGRVSCVV